MWVTVVGLFTVHHAPHLPTRPLPPSLRASRGSPFLSEALRLKILALAQPAAEGVSPYDAAGMDQAPPGYSSVGSSGAPPSLSPLSPAFPLGCASVFGSGLSAWLRFGWDPGGAVAMRGCEQRSAAACA